MTTGSPASISGSAYLGGGQPQYIGASATELVGFYGATPIVQPASSSEAAVTSTASVSISATQWGFATSTQATGIVTLVNQLRADLVALGLIKGSA